MIYAVILIFWLEPWIMLCAYCGNPVPRWWIRMLLWPLILTIPRVQRWHSSSKQIEKDYDSYWKPRFARRDRRLIKFLTIMALFCFVIRHGLWLDFYEPNREWAGAVFIGKGWASERAANSHERWALKHSAYTHMYH